MAPTDAAKAANTAKKGKKKGSPITSTPTATGINATDRAARGTAGTSRYLTAGIFSGRSVTTVDNVEPPASARPSTVLNQFWERLVNALISGRSGPLSRSFTRRVGWRTSSPAAACSPESSLLASPLTFSLSSCSAATDSSTSCRMSHCCSFTRRAFFRRVMAIRSGWAGSP